MDFDAAAAAAAAAAVWQTCKWQMRLSHDKCNTWAVPACTSLSADWLLLPTLQVQHPGDSVQGTTRTSTAFLFGLSSKECASHAGLLNESDRQQGLTVPFLFSCSSKECT